MVGAASVVVVSATVVDVVSTSSSSVGVVSAQAAGRKTPISTSNTPTVLRAERGQMPKSRHADLTGLLGPILSPTSLLASQLGRSSARPGDGPGTHLRAGLQQASRVRPRGLVRLRGTDLLSDPT